MCEKINKRVGRLFFYENLCVCVCVCLYKNYSLRHSLLFTLIYRHQIKSLRFIYNSIAEKEKKTKKK